MESKNIRKYSINELQNAITTEIEKLKIDGSVVSNVTINIRLLGDEKIYESYIEYE